MLRLMNTQLAVRRAVVVATILAFALGAAPAFAALPTASNVNITGTTEVGFQLTGSYLYDDTDGHPEGASTFRWLRDNNPIGGAFGSQYTLVALDEGAQIIFEVTPAATTGVSPGIAAQSSAVGPIAAANTAPTASNVNITGTTEIPRERRHSAGCGITIQSGVLLVRSTRS